MSDQEPKAPVMTRVCCARISVHLVEIVGDNPDEIATATPAGVELYMQVGDRDEHGAGSDLVAVITTEKHSPIASFPIGDYPAIEGALRELVKAMASMHVRARDERESDGRAEECERGMICPGCERPIEPGQHVSNVTPEDGHGAAELHHAGCTPAARARR